MTHDLLREAALAVRETSDDDPGPALETRARILATLRDRRKRRLEVTKIVLPIAAVLVASTAWAAASGELRHVGGALRRGLDGGAEPVAPAGRAAPVVRAAASSVADIAVRVTAAPAATAAPPTQPAAAAPDPARPSPSASAATDGSEAHALYTAAHRAHFVDRSWGAALAAWERYLAVAPRGRFAAEASYNRALCLVRLGRTAEARAALEPFASGRAGEYRRDEARALIEAMQGSTR